MKFIYKNTMLEEIEEAHRDATRRNRKIEKVQMSRGEYRRLLLQLQETDLDLFRDESVGMKGMICGIPLEVVK